MTIVRDILYLVENQMPLFFLDEMFGYIAFDKVRWAPQYVERPVEYASSSCDPDQALKYIARPVKPSLFVGRQKTVIPLTDTLSERPSTRDGAVRAAETALHQ
jgi:hypothetical protein